MVGGVLVSSLCVYFIAKRSLSFARACRGVVNWTEWNVDSVFILYEWLVVDKVVRWECKRWNRVTVAGGEEALLHPSVTPHITSLETGERFNWDIQVVIRQKSSYGKLISQEKFYGQNLYDNLRKIFKNTSRFKQQATKLYTEKTNKSLYKETRA